MKNIEDYKTKAITFILNSNAETSSKEIFERIGGNPEDLPNFQRHLLSWREEFNKQQLEWVITEKTKKENALMIVGSKSGGYSVARDLDECENGLKKYVATISSEAKTASMMVKFIEIVHHQE